MVDCHHENCIDNSCVAKVPIFAKLSPEEMLEVAKVTVKRVFAEGEFIFFQGDLIDKLYVIHEGSVKVSRMSEEGREQVIRILGPGDFLGELVLFAPSPAGNSAEALEKTVVCEVESSKIKELMLSSSKIAVKLLEEMSRRLEEAENLLESISLLSVDKRIVKSLLEFAGETDEVVLPISKRDLAAQLSITQETLSRKFTALQEEGLVALSGQRKIRLLDRAKLKDILDE